MPLPKTIAEIGDRIVGYFDNRSNPPFIIYQYEPADEYAVRRELLDLCRWLEAEPREVECQTISLAQVLWEALEDGGQLEMVIEAERAGDTEDAQLAVRQILSMSPTLADRLLQKIDGDDAKKSAIFLYRAGALYPAHRTSTLLDELKAQVSRPVVLLYPGRVIGDYGLSFMGKTEPTYGYRALIIPRGRG